MFKRIISGICLATVLATGAQAQVLHYYGGADYNSETAKFLSGPDASASAFQVWCVDQDHGISTNPGDYLVRYTKLDAASFAGTRRAGDGDAAAQLKYTKAAYLASTMTGNTLVNIKQKQYAMWAIINGKAAGNECTNWGIINHDAECVLGSVQANITTAGANFGTVVQNQWVILTGRPNGTVDPYGYPNGNYVWNSVDMQELIARCVYQGRTQAPGAAGAVAQGIETPLCDDPWNPPNEETVPEPATMSLLALGLAGMAGSSLRRRKK